MNPSTMPLADVIAALPPSIAAEITDAISRSANPVLRRWAVDESRRLRHEIMARERADAELRERRRQMARQHLSALRQELTT